MSKKLNLYFVFGGAVSAGAYTAGVIDYFMHRLKTYQSQSDTNRTYQPVIKAVAGTSAGGMCAAVFTNSLVKGFPDDIYQSAQHEAWVKQISIDKLSRTDDLNDGELQGLLNNSCLFEIADNAFKGTPYGNERKLNPYVDEKLKLIFNVTNTSGLSYAVDFMNSDFKNPYFITDHRDYFKFSLKPEDEGEAAEEIPLINESDWNYLKKVTIATGSFPIGLPPVKLSRPSAYYKKHRDIDGLIPFNIGGQTVEYIAVDGGIGDNEPLGQIQKLYEKDNEEKCIVFIDPFPSELKSLPENLKGHIGRLYSTLRNQSAFKPDEVSGKQIAYFLRHNTESQPVFFIGPKREYTDAQDLHVAGGAIGAFSGFISESYRQHDYDLGLRNCQRFVNTHFKLNGKLIFDSIDEDPIGLPEWPSISRKEYKTIIKPLNKRTRKILSMELNGVIGFLLRKYPSKKIRSILESHHLIQ